jgi:hypothetical protein
MSKQISNDLVLMTPFLVAMGARVVSADISSAFRANNRLPIMHYEETTMSKNDSITLENILSKAKLSFPTSAKDSEFFELFTADQILKDYELSYEEILAGIVGSSLDGGIDAAYVFVNGMLIQEDTILESIGSFKKDVTLEFVAIQSKTTPGFSEEAVHKLTASFGELFDLTSVW